ncbi:hypothetical protein ACFYWS_20705 [Streptomyces sp. NPDC002795]|uniref:hypothetical protein n=1 Tax=Streptomyces sp. NPDC002795 TaxID=3364665 RepID=UPI0036960A8C
MAWLPLMGHFQSELDEHLFNVARVGDVRYARADENDRRVLRVSAELAHHQVRVTLAVVHDERGLVDSVTCAHSSHGAMTEPFCQLQAYRDFWF